MSNKHEKMSDIIICQGNTNENHNEIYKTPSRMAQIWVTDGALTRILLLSGERKLFFE